MGCDKLQNMMLKSEENQATLSRTKWNCYAGWNPAKKHSTHSPGNSQTFSMWILAIEHTHHRGPLLCGVCNESFKYDTINNWYSFEHMKPIRQAQYFPSSICIVRKLKETEVETKYILKMMLYYNMNM